MFVNSYNGSLNIYLAFFFWSWWRRKGKTRRDNDCWMFKSGKWDIRYLKREGDIWEGFCKTNRLGEEDRWCSRKFWKWHLEWKEDDIWWKSIVCGFIWCLMSVWIRHQLVNTFVLTRLRFYLLVIATNVKEKHDKQHSQFLWLVLI